MKYRIPCTYTLIVATLHKQICLIEIIACNTLRRPPCIRFLLKLFKTLFFRYTDGFLSIITILRTCRPICQRA